MINKTLSMDHIGSNSWVTQILHKNTESPFSNLPPLVHSLVCVSHARVIMITTCKLLSFDD